MLAGSLWLVPLARRRLAAADLADAAVMAVGIGASLGGLSLWMLVLGLLPGAWLLPALVLPVPWLGLALQLLAGQHTTPRHKPARVQPLALLCAGTLLVITINTLSYPFYRYDVLARFAPNARQLFEEAHISASLTGYPLAVQLQYAFAFMAAGAVNDHYAGVIVAAYAAALALATFAVARIAFNGRAAWCAVVLLLSAPLFVDWATSGYVDVPVALYHALALLFALRWLHSGARADALGAGICAGLGILTKHSALVLLPAVAVVPLLRNRSRTDFENAALALLAAFALAGPWYARNLLLAGWGGVLPAPGAYDAQALDTSVATLLTFWSDRAEWGAPFSVAAASGLLLAAAQLLHPRLNPAVPNARQRIWLFAAFIVPYQLLWWQGFSYQTRYLLASAPMFAAIGGYGVDWLLQRLPALARLPQPAVLGLAAGLLALGAYGRLGAVYHLALHPLQSDADKLARLSPGLWPLAQRMRATLPAGSRLYTMEGALAYWLPEYPYQYGFPVALADLRGFDYLVVSPIGESVYAFGGTLNNEVLSALGDPALLPLQFEQADGSAVYAVGAGLR